MNGRVKEEEMFGKLIISHLPVKYGSNFNVPRGTGNA